MRSEPADEVPEAKADAQRRSWRAAVRAIETYLAAKSGKDAQTDPRGSTESEKD